MLSRVHSVGVRGVDGYPVLVELDLANGLPGFTTVGLPDSAVRESRERVASAVRNSGYRFPNRRITVNLAPAQSRKQGTQYDLPIALAVLSASGQLSASESARNWTSLYCFIGELALDGSLRPVHGVLAMALQAKKEGFEAIVVPERNAEEASAVGIKTFSATTLREVADFINGGRLREVLERAPSVNAAQMSDDLSDVKAQFEAKRALEIAAAGGHNLLLIGPPGAGKSMLAKRLITLLPPMTRGESMEATRVHSASGRPGLVEARPFRSPHHSASAVSLIGGGPAARPGEASLAHGGVLFLDEIAEFSRSSLEALRQPLEDHRVAVSRAKEAVVYPAKFLLVAATNPCPCGWRGQGAPQCVCTPPAIQKYLARLSGPLLDRIDIQVEVPALDFKQWAQKPAQAGETSAVVAQRVVQARAAQRRRFASEDFAVNAYIPARELRRHCGVDAQGLEALEKVCASGQASARGLDRALRVARTIADLRGSTLVETRDLLEAMRFRSLERLARVC